MLDKCFKAELVRFSEMLQKGENFAFVRFSDGEADILRNLKLVLADDHVIEGNIRHSFGYGKEDHKHFDPHQHAFVREKLINSFLFSKYNYFVGIACPCCIGGVPMHTFMKREVGTPNNFLTWANLFVNGNYSDFLSKIVPTLKEKKIVMVVSKNANLSELSEKLSLNIVKDFRVGENCIVNDHHLIDEIKDWVLKNDIKDHVFLFAASSLSEILIHELYKDFDFNTYLDIGTTLHPYMKLGYERAYLKGFWLKQPQESIHKICQWIFDIRFVPSTEEFWEDIRNLRNHPSVKSGFIQQDHISHEEHAEFMKKYFKNYYITICENEFAGFIGVINNDIRVAVHPDFQGKNIGTFMVNELMKLHPIAAAKVKINNEASLKLFEKCGFKKKYYILEK